MSKKKVTMTELIYAYFKHNKAYCSEIQVPYNVKSTHICVKIDNIVI